MALDLRGVGAGASAAPASSSGSGSQGPDAPPSSHFRAKRKAKYSSRKIDFPLDTDTGVSKIYRSVKGGPTVQSNRKLANVYHAVKPEPSSQSQEAGVYAASSASFLDEQFDQPAASAAQAHGPGSAVDEESASAAQAHGSNDDFADSAIAAAAAAAVDDSVDSAIPADFSLPRYALCNEKNQKATITALKAMVTEDGAHIGFAGWFNYDIMAASKSRQGVICDIDPKMIEFYEIFKKIILASSTREEFIQKLKPVFEKDPIYLEDWSVFELSSELNRLGGWLSSDENYEFIRTMHIEERVAYRNLNAAGDLADYQQIREEHAPFSTIYASNVYEWLEQSDLSQQNAFKSNMASLLEPDALYVDAFYPHTSKNGMPIQNGSGPPLRISQGKLPSFTRTQEVNSNPRARS